MRYCPACHRCYGGGVEFCLFDHTPTRSIESLPLVIDGKYRLEQLIAHGGMGSVYRATHLQLDRPVAIKILRAEYLADPTVCERFNREARAAARLKHPNIVAVYDFGMLPTGGAYLVMELIVGRSLREEMRTNSVRLGQMRPERAAQILTQVCSGIDAAHRQGIVHRDLKPDNIMIETSEDGYDRVLVLDFGIAKLKDREPFLRGITDENTIVGTPNYISPEQCTGHYVDKRSDIYSLGIILYEMITGRVPFSGQNTSAVLLRHLQEPPSPPSRFRQGLSPEIERVILRALAKNPAHRFNTALDFSSRLIAAVNSSLQADYQVEFEDETTRDREPVRPSPMRQEPVQEEPSEQIETNLVSEPWDNRENQDDHIAEFQDYDPSFIIEHRSRKGTFAGLALIALIAAGLFVYFSGFNLSKLLNMATLEAQADEKETQAGPGQPQSPQSASNAAKEPARVKQGVVQQTDQAALTSALLNANETDKKSSPIVAAKNDATLISANFNERAQREVRALYTEWVASAVRGDWAKHAGYYAGRVDYFRDGSMTRSKVEARKRRIFSGLDSYTLRFSENPQVNLKNSNGIEEAELIFDRQWVLKNGRKRVEGKAKGVVTLRHGPKGWRIVSERQVRK